MIVLAWLLFFVLTPGVALSLPKDGSIQTQAAVHATVFTAVYSIIAVVLLKVLKK